MRTIPICPASSLIAAFNAHDTNMPRQFRVLSAVWLIGHRMLASDGGSAEVVHALVAATAVTGINGDGLIRAMRPGGTLPLG
jgi:hypothetical protein